MSKRREKRTPLRVESLEGRQLTATFLSWMTAGWTAEVETNAGSSFSEITVSKTADDASSGF